MTASVAATSFWVEDEPRSATSGSLSLLTPSCTFPDLQGRRIYALRAHWGFIAVTSIRGVMLGAQGSRHWLRLCHLVATSHGRATAESGRLCANLPGHSSLRRGLREGVSDPVLPGRY